MGVKVIKEIFGKELKVINIGLQQFAEDLKAEGVQCVNMDWRPPAQGEQEAADLLKLLLG